MVWRSVELLADEVVRLSSSEHFALGGPPIDSMLAALAASPRFYSLSLTAAVDSLDGVATHIVHSFLENPNTKLSTLWVFLPYIAIPRKMQILQMLYDRTLSQLYSKSFAVFDDLESMVTLLESIAVAQHPGDVSLKIYLISMIKKGDVNALLVSSAFRSGAVMKLLNLVNQLGSQSAAFRIVSDIIDREDFHRIGGALLDKSNFTFSKLFHSSNQLVGNTF